MAEHIAKTHRADIDGLVMHGDAQEFLKLLIRALVVEAHGPDGQHGKIVGQAFGGTPPVQCMCHSIVLLQCYLTG